MFRIRRYRVFLAFTIFVFLGIYYLIDTRGWGGRSTVAFKNARPQTEISPSRDEIGSSKSKPGGSGKDSTLPPSKSRPDTAAQIALPGEDTKPGRGKGGQKEKGKALEFPHKKPSEGPDIDEKLPKGKHDKHTATSTVEPVHFTKVPEHFPIPEKSLISLPTGRPKTIPRIQNNFARETTPERRDRMKKLKKLKKTFLRHWAGYKEHAWDHDELRPVSGGFRDPFAGWRATLVDTLDMLWIMGLKDEFEEAVEEVGTIDFTTTPRDTLPLFEVVIRYLGGLIAAYDISEGKYPVLLDKAKELAEVLMPAFDTPNRMPVTQYRWRSEALKQPKIASGASVLAEIGSLNMEFIRLAQITHNDKYYDAVARITDEFEALQNETKVPGLWPLGIDATGGCAVGDLEKERVEKVKGMTVENTGTSSESEVEDILAQKDRSSFGEDGTDTSKGTSSAGSTKPKSKSNPKNALSDVDSVEGGSQKAVSGRGSSPSYNKRAPPTHAEDSNQQNDKSSSRGDESGKTKKPVPDDATAHRSSSKYQTDKERLNSDDQDVPKAERPSSREKSTRLSSSELTRQKDTSSFGADEFAALDRPGLDGKGPKSGIEQKTTQKDRSSFGEDDSSVGTRKAIPKGGTLDSSAEGQVTQTGKSSAREHASTGQRRPLSDEKPIGSNSDSQRKSKDKSSFGEHGDEDLNKLEPDIRYNKPRHKCVSRGLRSQYGEHGIDKYTLGGMADSVYEYLPKSYLLLGGLENQYRRMHEAVMPAVKEYLLFRAMTNETRRHVFFTGDFSSMGVYNNETERVEGTFTPHTGHLTCFQGAFIALAGRAFKNEKEVDLARKLTDGCVWAYEQTATGVMPELLDLVPCVNKTGPCKFNETRWWNMIDPNAEEKVKINARLIAEAEADSGHKSGSGKKHKSRLQGLIKRYFKRSKSSEQHALEYDNDKQESESEHDPALPLQLKDDPAPNGALKLERRRPPNKPVPQDPEEARSSIMAQPTTVPDHMRKTTTEQHLAPGITRIGAKEYILRPEALESVFYMYRITGDPYWRDKGWHMFESIDNATRTEYGNSAIADVTVSDPTYSDKAESFWTAETLKYLYLLFSEPSVLSLDDWVFNTEAHPFRRPDLDIKRERQAEQMRRRKGMGGDMVWDLD